MLEVKEQKKEEEKG
jgi:hypothetical protein